MRQVTERQIDIERALISRIPTNGEIVHTRRGNIAEGVNGRTSDIKVIGAYRRQPCLLVAANLIEMPRQGGARLMGRSGHGTAEHLRGALGREDWAMHRELIMDRDNLVKAERRKEFELRAGKPSPGVPGEGRPFRLQPSEEIWIACVKCLRHKNALKSTTICGHGEGTRITEMRPRLGGG